MKLLLDTSVLLWALGSPEEIDPVARAAIEAGENDVLVSAASAWEVAIKQSVGRLHLPSPAEEWLPRAVAGSGFEWLPVSPADALAVGTLPWHHRDPFDRLLVAQTRLGLTLATRDRRMEAYGVPILRA